MNHAWTGHADINHGLSFTHAMKSAGHKWIVFDCIRKADKLRTRESISIARTLGGFFDDPANLSHHVHVDAGARRRRVH